jgi:hypothetical protein
MEVVKSMRIPNISATILSLKSRSDSQCSETPILIHALLFNDYTMVPFDKSKSERLIIFCGQIERICLLELAVWKAMFITNPHLQLVTDYRSWQEWIRTSWKVNKSEVRTSDSVPIIVSHLISFLEEENYRSAVECLVI